MVILLKTMTIENNRVIVKNQLMLAITLTITCNWTANFSITITTGIDLCVIYRHNTETDSGL